LKRRDFDDKLKSANGTTLCKHSLCKNRWIMKSEQELHLGEPTNYLLVTTSPLDKLEYQPLFEKEPALPPGEIVEPKY